MAKIEYSLVDTIELQLDSTTASEIITIYQNTGTQNTIPDTTVVTINAFIKNLKAYAEIKSLASVILPSFSVEDSESEKTMKMLNSQWGSARKQLDLFISKNGGTWRKCGAVSMVNPSGYPFMTYNLQDVFTPNLAIELGQSGKIGCKITDVGYGLLTGSDFITIHGSYAEEIVAYENEITFNNCTPQAWDITANQLTSLLAANENRKYFLVQNNSTQPVYLHLGSTAELGKGIALSGQGSYFDSANIPLYKGEVSVIAANNASLIGEECI